MTALAHHVPTAPPLRRADFQRWRRRSRLIRTLRVALPAAIAAIFAALGGAVALSTMREPTSVASGQDEAIRLINPRFVGRDDKGRAFVLTAASAIRDPADYQRVMLDQPALVLDEAGPDQMRVGGRTGVYHEGTLKLQLNGGVRLSTANGAFDTAESLFDTKTGELVGSGPIQGSGPLGEIAAKSYSMTGKGDRLVFGGGVRARIDSK